MTSRLTGRYVGVIGPGTDPPDDHVAAAFQIGEDLAARGAVVITGGMGGVMRAAASGVRQGGGVSIGLLPGDDRSGASQEHTFTIPTGLGEMRNPLLIRAVDAVVAVGCSWGTMSEVALAIRTGVPLVHLYGWDDYRSEGELAESPQEAVSLVEEILSSPRL